MAEITPKGYSLKTVNQWFDEERQLYVDIDPNWNLDPSTPDGLKIAHDSEVFGALDETLQQAYNSKDPSKASGYDLNIISALTGTTRSEGTASTITDAVLNGVVGTIVPAGTRFKSRTTGTVWTLDQTWTLDSTGSAVVSLSSSTVGRIEADANSITQIVDTVGGLTSVNNPNPATPGTYAESDSSLRVKRATAVGRPGNNQIDSMTGELFAVEGVRRVRVYENDTNTTDVNGLPPHSIAPVIDGGEDADVAMAIYIKKNPGVFLYQAGTPVSVEVTSPTYSFNKQVINFSRPEYVDMVISITIKDDGSLPSDISGEIQDAFIDFVDGDLVPAEYGFKVDGFDIGEDVPYSTLFTPINKVIGQYGNSYVQSMTVNGGTSNVTIAFNELSRWTTSNITVTIV
jgi:Uncharacterized homolog of phage Mu protein gp47